MYYLIKCSFKFYIENLSNNIQKFIDITFSLLLAFITALQVLLHNIENFFCKNDALIC